MSQTERTSDLPELPCGLNRMVMTSARLLPYRPSLVRFLTLGVGTVLAAAGLVIGGGLGVLPALGFMAGSALGMNMMATLCDLGLKKLFYTGDTKPVAALPSPSLAFAMRLGQRLITAQTNEPSPIRLCLSTDINNYRATISRDSHTVIEMNPSYVAGLYENLTRYDGVSAGTARFAEIHAFALQHEIQHRQQPSWQDTFGQSIFLASATGLVGTTLTFLANSLSPDITPAIQAMPSLTQIFACLAAPTGIYALNLIRTRQNEFDADSAAVRNLGSAAAARAFFGAPETGRKLIHPSPALRIAAAELQESRLTEAERRSARAAFNALYETTIAEFPELGGQRHPTGSPSSVRQNSPELT